MFDTVKIQVAGIDCGADFETWARQEFPGADFHERLYEWDSKPWRGVQMKDPILGQIGVRSNKRGTFLWVERSLPKFLYGDNCRMLTVEETREGLDALLLAVRLRFADWWVFPENWHQCVKFQRLDICYDRHIPSSQEVFAHIARSVKSNPKMATWLYGVGIPHNRWEYTRFYDKGLESGNEQYQDMIRHEEQLRGGKAAYLVEPGSLEIRVDEAREQMNKRFAGWPSCEVENYGFAQLLEEHKAAGAGAVGLVLMPQLDAIYKRCLSKDAYYKYRALALEVQRHLSRVDLRVPGDSWL